LSVQASPPLLPLIIPPAQALGLSVGSVAGVWEARGEPLPVTVLSSNRPVADGEHSGLLTTQLTQVQRAASDTIA